MNKRRDFLKISGLTVSTFMLSQMFPGIKFMSSVANAAGPNHFFVLYRIKGGMDVTLGLDPQGMGKIIDPLDMFIQYRPEDILSSKNISFAPGCAPLKPYANDCAVVNGIFMSPGDNGHDQGNLYMASGINNAKAESLPFSLMSIAPTPLKVLTSGATITGQTSEKTEISSLINAQNQGRLDTLLASIQDSMPLSTASPLEKGKRDYIESMGELPALQEKFSKLGGSLTDAQVLAATFATGSAKQAEIVIEEFSGLDSHSDHESKHLAAQVQIYTKIAETFKIFKETQYGEGSLFDATTFMVVCEFSRTPALNGSRGKDHNNSTNSVLLAGKGINGGQTFGKSVLVPRSKTQNGVPLHIGGAFDFETGLPAKHRQGAGFIQPENVTRTLVDVFGNPAGVSIDRNAPIIKGLKKS